MTIPLLRTLLVLVVSLCTLTLNAAAQDADSAQNADDAVQQADPAEDAAAPDNADTVDGEDEDPITGAIELVGDVFEATPWWGWLILAGGIFLGMLAGKISQMALRSTGEKAKSRGWIVRGLLFEDAASPVSLALLTLGLSLGFRSGLHLTPEIEAFAGKIFQFLYIFSIGWFFFNAVDVVEHGLRRFTDSGSHNLSAQLVPLIRKTLRVFIVVVFALFVAQNVFEVNITAWLAGLGIAGLAISLAAQDSIKNLFGSITVLLDKPFAVGDRIQFASADGFVEEVGFRSTKLRTFGGHLVTIPNMKFIDGDVENISARPFIRRTMDVTITYDTPPDKIDEAVQIVRDLLAEPELQEPFDLEERPPRVYFSNLNADSLNIAVTYWYMLSVTEGRDWWTYMEHAQTFNRRLFRAYSDAGIDFAFPTQTLYLAGDPNRELSLRLHSDGNVSPGNGADQS